MTIKFEDMEHDVKQSALRVIEQQFSQRGIEGHRHQACELVKTIKTAYQSLYEEEVTNQFKVNVSVKGSDGEVNVNNLIACSGCK